MHISVIIPVHNRPRRILRAIQSVVNQTVAAAEIIVVDDGSSDGTAIAVADSFPQVRLVRQANRGVSAARNHGIRVATSEWIALLDSDDEWLPDKLAKQCRLLKENASLRVCHSDEAWIRDGVQVNPMRKHRKPSGWIFRACLPLCCVSPSAIVLHRSVIETVGLFDESLPACEDYDMWLRCFCRFPIGLVESRCVVKYGGHADQLSRRYAAMDRYRVYALNKLLGNEALETVDREACILMLRKKCDILANGLVKRQRPLEALSYRQLSKRWNPS